MHISRERLVEFAQQHVVVSEPEWSHVKQCKECAREFFEIVRDTIRTKPQKETADSSN